MPLHAPSLLDSSLQEALFAGSLLEDGAALWPSTRERQPPVTRLHCLLLRRELPGGVDLPRVSNSSFLLFRTAFSMPGVSACLALLLLSSSVAASSWERAGCHKVGHTRQVRIPGCVVFEMTTNACRGFCASYATPSPLWILRSNLRQSLWSVAQCCNIMDTEDVVVEVMCLGGMKSLVFKSAKTCSCYHCKKE